jgi:hypothetical protein
MLSCVKACFFRAADADLESVSAAKSLCKTAHTDTLSASWRDFFLMSAFFDAVAAV